MKTRFEILEEHWMQHHYPDLWEWAEREIKGRAEIMVKTYIGVDPGQNGAMAVITPEQIVVFDFDDSFCLKWLKAISNLDIGDSSRGAKAVIEKATAMPKQGVSSMFKFGTNYGQWIGRLEVLGIPFDFVTPRKWQKEIYDSMPTKNMDKKALSLDRACRLFPEMREFLSRKKDHGRADALLICEYARRTDK